VERPARKTHPLLIQEIHLFKPEMVVVEMRLV
jgi:hypothetical protein